MIYMVLAYLIIWAASFVFILSMVQRQRNLEREIRALKAAMHEKETGR